MADYKRMVSYMYQYENGIKKKNVGFTRIETRGGQCKITLHMQLLGQLDSIFPAYLIQRGKHNLELIYLGDAILKNQVMDSKLSAEQNNIMGSGYALSDMGGLLLFLNDKVFFATQWDDKPVVAAEVMEALRPKSERQHNSETKKAVDNFREAAEAPMAIQDEKTLEEQMNIPSYMLPGGWKMVERQQNGSENRDSDRNNQLDTGQYRDKLFGLGREMSDPSKPEPMTLDQSRPELYQPADSVQMPPEAISSDTGQSNNWFIADQMEEVLNGIEHKQPEEPPEENKTESIDSSNQSYTGGFSPFEGWFGDELASQSMVNHMPEGYGIAPEDIWIQPGLDGNLDRQATGRYEQNYAQDAELQYSAAMANETLQEQGEKESYQGITYEEEQSASGTAQQANVDDSGNLYGSVTMEQESTLEQPLQTQESEAREAKHFLENYPRFYPFEDNEIIQCVKIEPKDIGLLPKEVWPYSNNSFLMHGFYSYHHLVFAKIQNQYDYRYILGVPGIYHGREQFMAKMFGFEHFKPIRNREAQQGDFGYWYLPVYL